VQVDALRAGRRGVRDLLKIAHGHNFSFPHGDGFRVGTFGSPVKTLALTKTRPLLPSCAVLHCPSKPTCGKTAKRNTKNRQRREILFTPLTLARFYPEFPF
jgi:hypothetical protein